MECFKEAVATSTLPLHASAGATGFLGSAILEQLLRLCPNVTVNLLIREKHGQPGEPPLRTDATSYGLDPATLCPHAHKALLVRHLLVRHLTSQGRAVQERLGQLLQKPLFHLLRNQGHASPDNLLERVIPVAGDMRAPGLGLSDADRWRLVSEVDTVIHCAASISFFEHIHRLLEQNYEVIMLAPVAEQRCHCGDMLPKCHNQSCHLMDCRLTVSACLLLQATRKTAELAREMPNLRAFVHVSTAFANAHLPKGAHVEERIYPLRSSDESQLQHAELAAVLAAAPPVRAAKLVCSLCHTSKMAWSSGTS